jgi:large subunit ribosomal protein L17
MSMLRNLAISLINSHEERIVTTVPKAKELRPFVERAITLSRRARSLDGEGSEAGAVHLRRQAAGFFHAGNTQQAGLAGRRGQLRPSRTAGVAALKRLFDELGERYRDRPGGYTRILKLGHREGDNAELAIIELVDNPREKEALEAAKKRSKHTVTAKNKHTVTAKKKRAGEGKKSSTADRARASEKVKTSEAVETIETSPDNETAEISGQVEEPEKLA